MGFICGLAVLYSFLVIFEGIIIRCESAPNQTPPNRIEDAQNIDTKIDLTILPEHLVELIFSKTEYKTIIGAIRGGLIPPNDILKSRILRDSLIVIEPEINAEPYGYGNIATSYIHLTNYEALSSFFTKFGDQVRKISISFWNKTDIQSEKGNTQSEEKKYKFFNLKKKVQSEKSDIQSRKSKYDILKTCAENLEELDISIGKDERIWEKIFYGKNVIIFPKVKNLKLLGQYSRHKPKLNLVFPKLESLELRGGAVENWLINVKGLKELMLYTNPIEEDKLEYIFQNNKDMTKICLERPQRKKTMDSIAKHLTNLETLVLHYPGKSFMSRANSSEVHELLSVAHLYIRFFNKKEVSEIGNRSFDIPHLKKLTLEGDQCDDQFIQFIENFKELNILELFAYFYSAEDCYSAVNQNNLIEFIKKFKHIEEFTTYYRNIYFAPLKDMFKTIDNDTKLQTLKLVKFSKESYEEHEKEMEKLNIELGQHGRPKWTLSHGTDFHMNTKYLMFKRVPSECESCEK